MKKQYFAPQTEIVYVCSESLLTTVSNTSAAQGSDAYSRESDWDE